MSTLIFDLETNGFLETCTKVHCATVIDVESGKQWNYRSDRDGDFLRSLLHVLDSADVIVGHNALAFDIPVLQKFAPWWEPKATVRDTLILTKLIWPAIKDWDFGRRKKNPDAIPGNLIGRHSLEAWGWRLKMHKGDYAKEMKAKGIDPWAEVNDAMVEYCDQDGQVTAKLWGLIQSKQYSDWAISLEHDVAQFCIEQERNGVTFNVQAAVELLSPLTARRQELSVALKERFGHWYRPLRNRTVKMSRRLFVPSDLGGQYKACKKYGLRVGYFEYTVEGAEYVPIELVEFNPASRDHIADRLIKLYGWQPEVLTDTGKPQVDESTLKHFDFPESSTLLEYLLVEKRIGQISEGNEAWLKWERNGRIHGRIDPLGTVTGRCAHRNPNLGQVPKVGKPYGAECRALFGGHHFVGADASGLELRMLAHYMAKYDDGEYARILLEGDIHWANVLALGFFPPGTVRDDSNIEHKKRRDQAKTFIYAFLYGAGDEKIGSIVGGSKAEGAALKKKFLSNLPALKKLVTKVKALAKKQGWLPGLDGRRLHVRSAHSALNTLLQSAGALVMKLALVYWHVAMEQDGYIRRRSLSQKDWDYAQVLWVHDEFQAECRTAEIAEICGETIVNAIRSVEQGFNLRCPLDGEHKVGNNWKETH